MEDPEQHIPTNAVRQGVTAKVLEELGLVSLYRSSLDVKLLCLQRFVRLFAYGISALILVAYLEILGSSKTEIGLFMTLTLVGDVCISLLLTLFADGLGRKATLALGAILMVASGIVFAISGAYWVLLIAAIAGVISPSGNEIGPFRAIEESIIAHLTDPYRRGDIYAWYSLLGFAGAAIGMACCGWVVQHLTESLHWDLIPAYRAIYLGYAATGVLKLILSLLLTKSVESEKKQRQTSDATEERAPLLNSSNEEAPKRGLRSVLPHISRESLPVAINLCLLFAIDSLGSGLAPMTWITYYVRSRFQVEEGILGTIFFVSQMLAAVSMIAASSLAKRFGNVNTMVFTHLPSSIFRALIGVPNDIRVALLFLFLNASTQSMDTAPRSAFLAMIIPPEERTAVMGAANVVKTISQSLGPLLTGFLADRRLFWVAFLGSGCSKALYDIGLLSMFKNKEKHNGIPEQRRTGDRNREEQGGSEESTQE